MLNNDQLTGVLYGLMQKCFMDALEKEGALTEESFAQALGALDTTYVVPAIDILVERGLVKQNDEGAYVKA